MPFSVGMWALVNTGAAAGGSFWSLCDTATNNNYFYLAHNTSWQIIAAAGGKNNSINVGTLVFDQWAYIVARFLSATNRRLAVLQPNGQAAHGQATTARAPTGLDTVSLGSRETSFPAFFLTGIVAEYWIADLDVQKDGAQLNDNLLQQLAFGGPFSVPHIATRWRRASPRR
jgi:hypothetical protein